MEVEKGVQEYDDVRKRKLKHFKKEIWLWVRTIFVVVLVVSLVRTFLFTNYIVYGKSMMPTVQDGERVIVNKIGYELFEPERFDLIIFRATETNYYIKRIIGLPGEHIMYVDDVLYVDGEPVAEDFLEEYRSEYDGIFTEDFKLEDITGKGRVPDGMVFVLGDNRINSYDSRHIGFVQIDDIVGEANLSYWPPRNIRFFK